MTQVALPESLPIHLNVLDFLSRGHILTLTWVMILQQPFDCFSFKSAQTFPYQPKQFLRVNKY